MSDKLTKTQEVFDQTKINVGDIVEYENYVKIVEAGVLNYEPEVVVGIIEEFHPNYVKVRCQDGEDTHLLTSVTVTVSNIGMLRVIKRSPVNERWYGE